MAAKLNFFQKGPFSQILSRAYNSLFFFLGGGGGGGGGAPHLQ